VAVKSNIIIDQGSTFSTTLNVVDSDGSPFNLSGYTGAAQMRKTYSSSTSYSFSVAVSDAAGGALVIAMTATETGAIPGGRYVYDVEITDAGGAISRVVQGIATISPEVTR
jgi:hypothetical protein